MTRNTDNQRATINRATSGFHDSDASGVAPEARTGSGQCCSNSIDSTSHIAIRGSGRVPSRGTSRSIFRRPSEGYLLRAVEVKWLTLSVTTGPNSEFQRFIGQCTPSGRMEAFGDIRSKSTRHFWSADRSEPAWPCQQRSPRISAGKADSVGSSLHASLDVRDGLLRGPQQQVKSGGRSYREIEKQPQFNASRSDQASSSYIGQIVAPGNWLSSRTHTSLGHPVTTAGPETRHISMTATHPRFGGTIGTPARRVDALGVRDGVRALSRTTLEDSHLSLTHRQLRTSPCDLSRAALCP